MTSHQAIPEKIQIGGWGVEDIVFLKVPGIFPLENPDKTTLQHCKFPKIVSEPLEIPNPKTKIH